MRKQGNLELNEVIVLRVLRGQPCHVITSFKATSCKNDKA